MLKMENHDELLREVFGESSDSEDDDPQHKHIGDPIPSWEQIKEINGLWLCRDFLSPQHQSSLISAVLNEGWFTEDSHNQAMRFGDLPAWATELSNSIREAVLLGHHVSKSTDLATSNGATGDCLLPLNLLWREPLFDQLIVNVYHPGEGICAHVDLMRFEDGIAIVSLESSCVMHFTRVEAGSNIVEQGEMHLRVGKIPVHLTPGSLVLMSGEARYLWKHEINRNPGFQMWGGQELIQEKRISITLRKLRQVE
ncbi:PREDICTED: alkylated DNA repair protein alkB homolog 8 [Theobroma cacao]|uniref:Alkylated DNA repair protein alkB homolog 8 n=1 Tax=Theobroma cacao TaxID=3641 RepID=A0AB32VR75_THECC|nr:PREDICTED: alkylated DNA repair protein alkB homolog 8 [Theobroma cacao]